jgi:outer membrane protein assembly factor BamB
MFRPVHPARSARFAGLTLLTAAALWLPGQAADWPQWRGPQRTGISAETGWKLWTGSGPRRLWSAQIGAGFSAVAVVGKRVYTVGNQGNRDTVYCFNADNGQIIWRHSYPQGAGDYAGPRATPVVDGSVVYTLSREGLAWSLDAATGKVNWGKDLRRETGAEIPRWGFGGSPLVHQGRIFYNIGSGGCALDGRGKVLWKTGGGPAGYASPMPFTAGGRSGVAIFTGKALIGVDPASGRRYWEHRWDTSHDVNAADPIFVGQDVFISSNYGRGCARLSLAGGSPRVVWENRNMRNHFNTSVIMGGAIYGNDENTLKCLDWATGQERWRERGGLGKGGLIGAPGRLIILTERGDLVIARATPASYQELARARVVGGNPWTHPVLANGRVYCRGQQGELVCLDLTTGR